MKKIAIILLFILLGHRSIAQERYKNFLDFIFAGEDSLFMPLGCSGQEVYIRLNDTAYYQIIMKNNISVHIDTISFSNYTNYTVSWETDEMIGLVSSCGSNCWSNRVLQFGRNSMHVFDMNFSFGYVLPKFNVSIQFDAEKIIITNLHDYNVQHVYDKRLNDALVWNISLIGMDHEKIIWSVYDDIGEHIEYATYHEANLIGNRPLCLWERSEDSLGR